MISLLLGTALASPITSCLADPTDQRYRCLYGVARTTGDYEHTTQAVRDALVEHPDHTWGLHTLGSLLTDQGKTKEGIAAFRSSVSRFDGEKDTTGRVFARLNLGKELQHQDDIEGALALYSEAATIAADNERPDLAHAARLSEARALIAARQRLGRAWSIAQEIEKEVFPEGHYQTQLLTLHVLTRVAELTHRDAERRALLQRQLELATKRGDTYVQASVHTDLADLRLSRAQEGGDATTLPTDLAPHLAAVREGPNPYLAARTWCFEALSADLLGEREIALPLADRCVTTTRPLEDPYDLQMALLTLASIAAPLDRERADAAWDEAATLLPEPSHRAALAVERLEFLGLSGRLDAMVEAVPDALEGVQTLRSQQDDPASRAGLTHSVHQHIPLAAAWLAGIDQQGPVDLDLALSLTDIARGAPVTTRIRVDQLVAALEEDEVVVAFHLPRTRIRAWATVLTAEGARVVELPGMAPFTDAVATFAGLVATDDPAVPVAARALYDRLLAPLELPPTRKLTLLPEGALHHLPFDALVGPEGPLVEQVDLQIAPSLSRWSTRPPVRTPTAPAVFADPAATDPDLPPLPHAREEGRAVAEVLDTEPQMGELATRDAILSSSSDWLHIAAHLTIDDRFPEQTALHLADGQRLTAEDVRSRRFDDTLVVLSACRSASGQPLGGEQPQGMTRAFLDAGASQVIGSLWPLRDDHAEHFFTTFYDHLDAGASVRAALAQTKRDLRAEGVPAAAWAGVVGVGVGDMHLERTTSGFPWPWFLGGTVLLAALAFGFRRRSG